MLMYMPIDNLIYHSNLRAMRPRIEPPENTLPVRHSCRANHSRHGAREQISYKNIRSFIAINTPVLVSVGVYSSFEMVPAAGIVPLPAPDETLLGGCEMYIFGYDDALSIFEAIASGKYYRIPYKYISSNELCYEITIVRT